MYAAGMLLGEKLLLDKPFGSAWCVRAARVAAEATLGGKCLPFKFASFSSMLRYGGKARPEAFPANTYHAENFDDKLSKSLGRFS